MNADERVPTAEDTLVPSPRPRRWLQKKGPEEIPGLRHFGLWVSLVVHARTLELLFFLLGRLTSEQ